LAGPQSCRVEAPFGYSKAVSVFPWPGPDKVSVIAGEGAILHDQSSRLFGSSYRRLAVLAVGLGLLVAVDGWCATEDLTNLVAADEELRFSLHQTAMAVEVVRTQTFEIHISPVGGRPIRWEIIDPAVVGSRSVTAGGGSTIDLIGTLDDTSVPVRTLDLVLVTADGVSFTELSDSPFELHREEEGDQTVVRCVSSVHPSGLVVTRTYRIPHRGFESELHLSLHNSGAERLIFDHLGRGPALVLGPGLGSPPPQAVGVGGGLYSYVRPVLGTGEGVEDVRLDSQHPEAEYGEPIHWGGVHRRYFLAALYPSSELEGPLIIASRAWLPPQTEAGESDADRDLRHFPIHALHIPPVTLDPGEQLDLELGLFFGPKDRRVLAGGPQRLDDVLFPGLWTWMRWLCFGIMWMLDVLHLVIPSWGLTIVALAVLMRLAMLPVAQVGIKHQAKMSEQQVVFKRRMADVNERYKDDPQRKSQESWRVFKEHGVGPVSTLKGCLWLVIQIPIFIALFNLLGQSFALRGARFLWIADLAEPDRLIALGFSMPLLGGYVNILPVVMAASQVLVSNISANSQANAAEKKRQNWFMLVLAIVFLVLFYSFPAGLVLYWTTSNLGQLLQQWLVGRGTRKAASAVPGARS